MLPSFFADHPRILILPSVMNGIVKSTADLRSKVMVRSQMARSAFCNENFIMCYYSFFCSCVKTLPKRGSILSRIPRQQQFETIVDISLIYFPAGAGPERVLTEESTQKRGETESGETAIRFNAGVERNGLVLIIHNGKIRSHMCMQVLVLSSERFD